MNSRHGEVGEVYSEMQVQRQLCVAMDVNS